MVSGYSHNKNVSTVMLVLQILFFFAKVKADSKPSSSRLPSNSSFLAKSQAKLFLRGSPGLPGRDGRDGRDAYLQGSPGKQGKPGRPGPPGLKGETGGVVYTRWGRKSCPNTYKTTQLYSGVMGGSHYSHHGGGSNYLCLPLHPIYDRYKSGTKGLSYIYGTEYEVNSQPNIFPKYLHDHDAPCAVCHTESRGSHVMIPARNVCPSGWTMEYKGYLMAAHHGHAGRTEFICVDGNPTATIGTHADKNGALLYFVGGICGSLPCGPYVQGNEFTCAVCTK